MFWWKMSKLVELIKFGRLYRNFNIRKNDLVEFIYCIGINQKNLEMIDVIPIHQDGYDAGVSQMFYFTIIQNYKVVEDG